MYHESVDSVINLEDCRGKKGSEKNQAFVHKRKVRVICDRAEDYLAAAGEIYGALNAIYESALNYNELYRIAAKIIADEFAQRQISARQGRITNYSAGAVTSAGFENYLSIPPEGYRKVYLINAPVGAGSERLLDIFTGSAFYRGYEVEAYYLPKKPAAKLEHLLIPEPGVAFVTSGPYCTIPGSLFKAEAEVVPVDLKHVFHDDLIRRKAHILKNSERKMDELLEKGIYYLKLAEKERYLSASSPDLSSIRLPEPLSL